MPAIYPPPSQEEQLPWLNAPGYQARSYDLPQQTPQAQNQYIPSPYEENTPQYQYNAPTAPQTITQPPAQNFASNDQGPIDINPYAGAYRRGAQQAPITQPQNNIKQNMDAKVRELARQRFFEEQGIKVPKTTQDYGDFYNELGQQLKNRSNLSEAVLVPNNNYQIGNTYQARSGGQTWLHIENFPNKNIANDYGTRMFRYDENLRGLNIMLVNSEQPTQVGAVAMRIGPLGFEQANNLCTTVMSGGLSCSIKGGGPANARMPSFAKRENINKFWINLGTFADTPEAEYYWMFLREDNGDLLSALEYDMASAAEHGAFGEEAVQLRLGPFTARNRANQICNVMKYRNVACLVQ